MAVKALIKAQKADLIYLRETKIQAMSEGIVRNLGGGYSVLGYQSFADVGC